MGLGQVILSAVRVPTDQDTWSGYSAYPDQMGHFFSGSWGHRSKAEKSGLTQDYNFSNITVADILVTVLLETKIMGHILGHQV